jgi:hypothetical protein
LRRPDGYDAGAQARRHQSVMPNIGHEFLYLTNYSSDNISAYGLQDQSDLQGAHDEYVRAAEVVE